MDVGKYLGGAYLTQLDLPAPIQTVTIEKVEEKFLGAEPTICISLAEFPRKPLALNKENLRRLVALYTRESAAWLGRRVLVYRTRTAYQGRQTLCLRLCGPDQRPPEAVLDGRGEPASPRPEPIPSAPAPFVDAAQEPPAPPAAVPRPWQPPPESPPPMSPI